MSFAPEVSNELGKPLDGSKIKSRSQAGQNLSYIEGHHAIREANRIFGFGGWDRETCDLNLVQQAEANGKARVAYTCRVRITVQGVTRDGVGYGQGINADLGSAHESAIKEAETDAMKRALMTFGDPFGLALYDKTQEHVDRGGRMKIEDGEPWVRSLIGDLYPVFVQDCEARGFDPLEIAKSARGAQVRDNAQLQKYVEDRTKQQAVAR